MYSINKLKVEKYPDKTFIGRIAKGFDFLGYSFEPKGLSIAPKTLANFLERKTQLYEQGADVRRIGQSVRLSTRSKCLFRTRSHRRFPGRGQACNGAAPYVCARDPGL